MASPAADTPLAPVDNELLPFKKADTLLEVRDLRVHFLTDFGVVKAVDGVNFTVNPGETLAIVGESGSGKSVSALAILGLIAPPGEILGGSILFKDQELVGMSAERFQSIRGNQIAMIFQDPLSSLNPVFPVGRQVAEVLQTHEGLSRRQAMKRAIELLALVGLPRPEERAHDYPHQFSGGMRQRVMIAMAICMRPSILIADEATTALDVTVQAQILDLIISLQKEFHMGLVLITHDLGVVAEHADTVAVMYAGKIAEYSAVDDLFYRSLHPYTMGLMSSIARLDKGRTKRLLPIPGQPPSLIHVPTGCPFHPRCPYAREVCSESYPDLLPRTGDPTHLAACHFAGDLSEPRWQLEESET